MSDIGPQLPPHLVAKRKRQEEEAAALLKEPTTTTLANANGLSSHRDDKNLDIEEATEKKRRIVGPALPPAPINEMPTQPAEDAEESSSDDDIGPSLPSATSYDVSLVLLSFLVIAQNLTLKSWIGR